jgi:glycosyltransferase involved in cell wall biosynthesis
MNIDVAICTWNRSALLTQTLERMRAVYVPPDVTWQLIIVDNNSTDATPEVVRRFSSCLPVRSIFEAQPGQAVARNRALRETRADYLIWTDDDVLVDPDWLSAYARAFVEHPDAAFFGGPVEPWFDGNPPRWLATHWQQVANVFAVRQLGDEAFALDTMRVPYGANFAVKVDTQREYPYDPSLGLRPGSEVRGEETQTLRRMLDAGHTGWWVPRAKVLHFVPHERQRISYLRRFFIGQGELQGRSHPHDPAPRLFGRPRWLIKRALAAEARFQWSRWTSSPDVWLNHLVDAAVIWGHVKAAASRGEKLS